MRLSTICWFVLYICFGIEYMWVKGMKEANFLFWVVLVLFMIWYELIRNNYQTRKK